MTEKCEDMEEEMKMLTLTREKYRLECEMWSKEFKELETAHADLKQKFEDQTRLLTNVVTHNKNHADSLKTIPDIAHSEGNLGPE